MYSELKQQVLRTEEPSSAFAPLQHFLLCASFLNLLIIASLGLLMRAYPFIEHPFFNYKFLVHAHSHFAFGGWAMPVLLWLFMRYFKDVRDRIGYRHWRNLVWLSLVAAYGMLFSFPFQGYGPVSISFSTLCIVRDFYFAIIVWKHTKKMQQPVSIRFIRAGLFYLVISAAGPLATGPLAAMGRAGTPFYFDVIYFYLHFQYNGWFMFCLLGILYNVIERSPAGHKGMKVFWLMNAACIPAYFLSVLWGSPGWQFNVIGAAGAIAQLAALPMLYRDVTGAFSWRKFSGRLIAFTMVAVSAKFVLQLLSALPVVAETAYQHRNFIIAYLHLVLLGFISMAAFALVANTFRSSKPLRVPVAVFLTAFVTTELLLLLSGTSLLPASVLYSALFWLTLLFPLAAILLLRAVLRLSSGVQATNSSFGNYGVKTAMVR